MSKVIDREFAFIDRAGRKRKVQIGRRSVMRYGLSGPDYVLLKSDVPTIWVDGKELPWSPVFDKARTNGWLDQAIEDLIDEQDAAASSLRKSYSRSSRPPSTLTEAP